MRLMKLRGEILLFESSDELGAERARRLIFIQLLAVANAI